MTDEPCIECGHTKAQHTDPSGHHDDCQACFDDESLITVCDRWRDEPRGAGMEDGECFRGGEAAAFMAEQQDAARRLK